MLSMIEQLTLSTSHQTSFRRLLAPFRRLLFLSFFSILKIAVNAQVENCTNGLDDDGDELVDCYDQDCTCGGQCADFYYTTCNADCFYIPPCDTIMLGVQWTATVETGTYPVVVAGDMDADGVPEVVTYKVDGNEIFILDGATGALKVTITSPTNYPGGTAPAIADLDNDGFGEVVMVGIDRRVRCWEHDGALKWTSNFQAGYWPRFRWSTISIADFDHDGLPEVSVGNQVYNGQTGVQLAFGGTNTSFGEHPARVAAGFSFNQAVVVDALPDAFCPDCQGLEIVAGNQVLSVNLQTGAVTPVVTAAAPYTDGFTSVVDFDRDGDLDAIVQGKKGALNYVYVWEIESPQVIREFKLYNNWQEGASRVNVADLNGDGDLEVSFISFPWFYALKNDFTELWTLPNDDVSAVTVSSVFDFCGDGSSDVIYRGSNYLQILEGATGKVKWQDKCISATHIENPLVLDVDADGQTEIVITCGANNQNFGTVVVYEAIGTPGIASRKVWNQHAYFNTNIEDDLRVPRVQQNPHLVGDGLQMNTFMNQYFNPTFPSPDGVLTLQNVECQQDSIAISARICNAGDNVLPQQTPISFYKFNPQRTQADWLGAVFMGFDLLPDECRDVQLKLPRIANDSIFIVLNDDHSKFAPFSLVNDFPVTNIGECHFENNVVAFQIKYNPSTLDLGKDTLICHNATVQLDAAGNDYIEWLWHDGTTTDAFLAPHEGLYAVTITDVCGIRQSDEIVITLDTSTVVRLGPDRSMCQGETFNLGESGFDFYIWQPALSVNCASCPSVVAGPSKSGLIILEAGFGNGCRSRDSIFVAVYDTFNYKIDTTICYGRTVMWNGAEILPDDSRTFNMQTIHGCDSILQVRVHGTKVGTFFFQIDTAVCQGKYLPFSTGIFPPDSTHVFYESAITGCDSTVLLRVAALDTFATDEDVVICFGETATVFGQNLSSSGTHRRMFTARNGCDSSHTVRLTVLPEIYLEIDGTPTCLNENTGVITASASGGAAPFSYVWDVVGETDASVGSLAAGNYAVTVTDSNDCTKTGNGDVPAYPPIIFSIEIDSVRCYGEENGAIRITSPDPTLLVNLDGQAWLQKFDFPNLPAGNYQIQLQDEHGCIETEPAPVYQPDEMFVVLPPDATLRLGDSLRLEVQSNGQNPLRYRWADTKYFSCDTCEHPVAKPWNTIRYVLTATDARGCSASDEVLLTVERIIGVFVPNVFSPAAENDENTRLAPYFGPAVERIKSFRIFDRWGTMHHEILDALPNDSANAWHGQHKNKPLSPGVYAWSLEVILVDGTSEWFRGDVTLVK